MKFDKKSVLLYAITDRSFTGRQTLYEQVESALKGGVTIVQLREKNLDKEAFIKEAKEIKELCRKYDVPLIINDSYEVAVASGADGVHIGADDCPVSEVRRKAGKNFIIGATAKTVEQAKKAEKDGADYLGVGAVFPSSTKTNAIRITGEELRTICSSVSIPAVAIGGIEKNNIHLLSGSGASGVAVVSAVFSADDIESECREILGISKACFVNEMKTVLTIAGSDSSGGAGIQADIKTMTMNGVYAMSAITALTAQNTTGVFAISEVSPEFMAQQIDSVFEDIRPDAVKIGMVSSKELVEAVADRLKYYQARNIVIDPVMVATSGSVLMKSDAMSSFSEELLPLATLVTPNIPEAEVLSGMKIENTDDMLKASRIISENYDCAVLCKGGHSVNDANDLLYSDGSFEWFNGKKIDNPNTHGTGCTLSSAIASNLAKGYNLSESVKRAKEYLTGALSDMLNLGKGSGPMNHAFLLK